MREHVRWYANAYRALFWLVMTPIAYLAGWLEMVTFVSLLSIWALVEAAWSTHRARMAEKEARKNNGV